MKEKILQKLDELNINYKVVEHPPVRTIEDMEKLGDIYDGAVICKNLFLRDQKGKRHFLLTIEEEKTVDLTKIAIKIGSTRLSFASPERLQKYLNLEPGAVTPLAMLNDTENAVELFLDEDLRKEKLLGVHPAVNTATVLITPNDLNTYVKNCSNNVRYIKL